MLVAACGKSSGAPAAVPEADPAGAASIAAAMIANAPSPAMVRDCTHADLGGGFAVTQRSLLAIAGKPIAKDPEHDVWMNPPELDAPAAQTLARPDADAKAKRQAAAQLLAAPFYVVYRIDNVDAPLALGVKELKRSTVSARVIRYEKNGRPTCATLFLFQEQKAVSDDAIARSDKTLVDPAVAETIRRDLTAQLLAHAPR
ncbi:MAG TPA: hypothetical protein VL463_23535 [Kofleriaceae bacterium]|nr:hypothetical protein [Kofleriaceae bacterium]